jgi:hypothetical protein
MDADRQRRVELRDERVREWQTRRRGPGDLVTWAVVLGGVMAVFVLFSAAYDGNTGFGGIMLAAIVAWMIVVSGPGGVNVPSILWGRSVDENLPYERLRIVLLASAALALVAVFLPVLDVASTLDFGWYGLIAGAIGVIYFILLARSGPGNLR